MEFCAEDIERYKQEMRTYARRAGYSVDPPEADAPPPVLTPASPGRRRGTPSVFWASR